MSGGLDYSKWDKLHFSDDEGEKASDSGSLVDSEDDMPQQPAGTQRRQAPVVTRLDHPSSVSIGPAGIQVNHPPKATASPFQSTPPVLQRVVESPAVLEEPRQQGQPRSSEDGTDDLEDDLLISKLTRNGQRCNGYFWSQIRDMATFVVILPALNVRGGNIHNFNVVRTAETCDVSVDGAAVLSFSVSLPGTAASIQQFSFVLRYPVKCDDDTIDGCWQLHTFAGKGLRVLVVELHKEPFAHQLYLWWDRACIGESPIDTTTLEDRKREHMAPSGLQHIWDEAHKEFRQRIKDRAIAHTINDSE